MTEKPNQTDAALTDRPTENKPGTSRFSALQAAAQLFRRPIFGTFPKPSEEKSQIPASVNPEPAAEAKPADEYAGRYPSNEPDETAAVAAEPSETKPADEYAGLYPSNEPDEAAAVAAEPSKVKPTDEYAGLYPSNEPDEAAAVAVEPSEAKPADEYAGLYPSNEPDETTAVAAEPSEAKSADEYAGLYPSNEPEPEEAAAAVAAEPSEAKPADEYAGRYPSNEPDETAAVAAEPSEAEPAYEYTGQYTSNEPDEAAAVAAEPSEAELEDENIREYIKDESDETIPFTDSVSDEMSEEVTSAAESSVSTQPEAAEPSLYEAQDYSVAPEEDEAGVSEPSAPDETAKEVSGLSASLSMDSRDLAEDGDTPSSAAEPIALLSDEEETHADEDDENSPDDNELRAALMALQQKIRAANIPVVIVFEGWDSAGKGTLVSKLIEGLDPRGYRVHPIRTLTEEESHYPAMRRYWCKMPAQGNISIFCSSWYREVSNACFESKAARKRLQQRYEEIVNLESELVCDGVLMIKFFLHISRKEQKIRLKALESKKNTRWRVTQEDWEQNERYEEYLRLYDAMIARTHFDGALWHVLRCDDKQTCEKQVYDIVISEFQAALKDRETNTRAWDMPFLPHMENMNARPFPQLDTFDPEQALTEPYKPAVDKAQKQLRRLQNELYRRGISMVVCFEGWDAAGKGGVIRRLTSSLDARGFNVVPTAAPTPIEKSHHYLWRFWQEIPKNGHIAIFDRTWYGRVMVERIEGLCTEAQWKRAYEEINRFEAEITSHGTILCKFWLQIDSETQLVRFQERESTPDKQWKITDEDWRNRSKWPQYEAAVNEMLQKTNTAAGPWTVVEANNKQYSRLKVLHTVIHAIEERLEKE